MVSRRDGSWTAHALVDRKALQPPARESQTGNSCQKAALQRLTGVKTFSTHSGCWGKFFYRLGLVLLLVRWLCCGDTVHLLCDEVSELRPYCSRESLYLTHYFHHKKDPSESSWCYMSDVNRLLLMNLMMCSFPSSLKTQQHQPCTVLLGYYSLVGIQLCVWWGASFSSHSCGFGLLTDCAIATAPCAQATLS